jgi:hypothetical protein
MVSFRLYMKGHRNMPDEKLFSHEDCEFGKWFYSTGMMEYGDLPEMKSLEKAHVRLHADVRDIVALKDSHGNEAKINRLIERVERASEEMHAILDDIRKKG